MIRILLPCVVVLSIASNASAQVIYEPVQYQHGGQNPYYYGGSDAMMHRYAQSVRNDAGTYGRVNGFDFVSADVHTHREVTGEGVRVFSDALGYRNARVYSYTASDARNDAYAAAPRYFRKADLIASAYRDGHGTLVVPATAPHPNLLRTPDVSPARDVPATRATSGRPLWIIPKDKLKKAQPPAGKIAGVEQR